MVSLRKKSLVLCSQSERDEETYNLFVKTAYLTQTELSPFIHDSLNFKDKLCAKTIIYSLTNFYFFQKLSRQFKKFGTKVRNSARRENQ